MNGPVSASELRESVQQLVRVLGLLQVKKTPCGQSMSVSQAHALMFLMGRVGASNPPSLKTLTEHLRLDKGSVSRLVSKMSADGLLRIEASPSDGRSKRVFLTERGSGMAANVDRASLLLFESLVARLSMDEPEQLTTLLDQLTSAIQAAAGTTSHDTSG